MSAICGMFCLDNRPIDPKALERIRRAGDWRGAYTEALWIDESVGMGYAGHWSTNDNRSQPWLAVDDGCTVISDARIDNRPELVTLLEGSLFRREGITQSELILAAYRRWGVTCPSYIVGDFSFAIWDRDSRTLLCARDALGVRPLFFWSGRNTFLFASFIGQLLQYPEIPRTLDDEYIAEFLARGDCPSEVTPYCGVQRLMPGWSVVVRNDGPQKFKYWDLDPQREIRYGKDEEYAEHFFEVFKNAVQPRLHSSGLVAADLSGGIDSSSIVCMAQEVYQGGGAQDRGFAAFTELYGDSSSADERRWSQAVTDKYKLETIYLRAYENWLLKDVDEETVYWDEPTPKILAVANLRAKGKVLAERGTKVLLSGIGGDQVLCSETDPIHLVDLLRTFRWRTLVRDAIRWQGTLQQPLSTIVYNNCIVPFLRPNSVFRPERSSEVTLSWVDTGFDKKYRVKKRMLHRDGFLPQRYTSPAFQGQYLNIMRVSAMLVQGYLMSTDIEARYPYLDRRLVEFIMAIPIEQKIRPHSESRSILRRAMRGILPEVVRTRKSKGGFDQSVYLSFEREQSRLERWTESLRVAARGYVDSRAFRKELELALVGSCANLYLFTTTLALELWLRGIEFREHSGNSLIPQTKPTSARVAAPA